MRPRKILVVGSGFAGAAHARSLADNGWSVDVIDRRPHIGGNAFDEVSAEGVRLHRYGPHLFHTNNKKIIEWFQRFAELDGYEHKVEAELPNGRCVPLPINRSTINLVFGLELTTPYEVAAFVASLAEPQKKIENAYQYLISQIGRTLTELFFRPYTRKMWAMDLDELDASVVKRIPLRYDNENRYFPSDQFQVLPKHGYAKAFENILDHKLIRVTVNKPFDRAMMQNYTHCFNSMPIDEFFEYDEGALPYRSIRFHNRREASDYKRGNTSVVNFTDAGAFTRETDWSRLPGHRINGTAKTITSEEPCDYRDNDMERYYPVKTSDGRHEATYGRYKLRAEAIPDLTFIGRCGCYQYLDMHQVINQSLISAMKWLSQNI